MGVRAGHVDLRDRLDRAIVSRRGEIDAVLRRFHVPGRGGGAHRAAPELGVLPKYEGGRRSARP